MRYLIILILALLAMPAPVPAAEMEDDPLLFMLSVDKLEMRASKGSNPTKWDLDAWAGYDLNKLWIKSEGEAKDGTLEEWELQFLYDRAVAPNWDLQVGIRRDMYQTPGKPDRNWLAAGFHGLAPYFIEIDTALFLGEDGHTAFRFKAEHEIMLTQRLVLVPELEIDAYGRKDDATETGSGLAESELSLRLKYEFVREFAPYIGVSLDTKHGQTADFAREEGEDVSTFRVVTGVSFWF